MEINSQIKDFQVAKCLCSASTRGGGGGCKERGEESKERTRVKCVAGAAGQEITQVRHGCEENRARRPL